MDPFPPTTNFQVLFRIRMTQESMPAGIRDQPPWKWAVRMKCNGEWVEGVEGEARDGIDVEGNPQ